MNAKRARDLRQRGYKLKGIASVMGVTVEEVREALRTPIDKERNCMNRAVSDLLAAGYDPEVIRANFPEVME